MTESKKSLEEEFEPLFNPQSVAVIGATNNWAKWGFSTFNSLLNGYKGKVYPINHREKEVVGRRAYKRTIDVPDNEPIDLAVFVIPAESVPNAMEDCVQKGVRAGVIISAGFAETGESGKKLQDRVLDIARKGALRFIGGNCMGFWSASSNLKAFMFPFPIMDGPLAFVSQGGNIGGNVVSSAYAKGIGFRSYVSCGCTADIQIEDYIAYFGNDPKVKVIMTYIEGLTEGARFIETVKQVSVKKPVIALKPGKTDAASLAIISHSGSLAGKSNLFDVAFKKAGVMRVNSPEELLDTAIGFVTQPLPKGKKVAIISPGGSYGVLTADACASAGLDVIKLSDETVSALDKIFPPRWSHGNPVDPAGDRDFIAYMKAPEILLKLPEVDALLFMGFGNFTGIAERFSGMNKDIIKLYQTFVQSLAKTAPSNDCPEDSGIVDNWLETVTRKAVEIFFSMFGTSASDETEAFIGKLIAVLKNKQIGSDLRKRFLHAADLLNRGRTNEGIRRFEKGFQALMEGLLMRWIEIYKKPLITTTFMEMPTVSDVGYHSYPTPERAAFVLTKLIAYREYLERIK